MRTKRLSRNLVTKKIANNLEILMLNLRATKHIEDFYTKPIFKKYRAHELTGNKKGITSLSVDYSYRMTLTVVVQVVEDEITILEVNKHYDE